VLYYQIQGLTECIISSPSITFSPYPSHHLLLQYAESIPHFRESLSINSLQVTLWFNLGYAALHEEDWSLCATAYQRYCSLDPEVLSCEPTDSATDFADPLGNPKRFSTMVKKQYEKYCLVHSLNIRNKALEEIRYVRCLAQHFIITLKVIYCCSYI